MHNWRPVGVNIQLWRIFTGLQRTTAPGPLRLNKLDAKVLLLLSIGHLVTDMYHGALPAILPLLKEKLLLSYTMAGTILIVSNVTSSVLQPIFGFFSDRKDKPILLPLGVFAAALGFSLLAFPSHYLTVLFLVAISGLGVASYHPEGYKIAHFFTGQMRATGMSIFSVGGNLGLAVGPILANAIINYLGLGSLPIIIIPALLFSVTVLFFRSTLTLHSHRVERADVRSAKASKAAVTSFSLLILIVIMRSCTQVGMMSYIPFYYMDYLKSDAIHAAKLVSIFLLGGAIGTLAGAPLADRFGHRLILMLSMLVSALIFRLFFVTQGILLFAVLFFFGLALISSFSITIVMAQRLLPHNLGIASGLTVGFAIGTGGIGATLLGVIADRFGVPFALKTISILPILGFVLSIILRYPVKTTERPFQTAVIEGSK